MVKCIGVMLAFLLGAGAVVGQTKVAVVSMQAALLETGELKKVQADMEARYKPRQQQIDQLQHDIQTLQQQLQGGKLNADGEADINAQGQRKQRELQRMDADLREDVQRDRERVLRASGQKMSDVIRKLADQRGYDLVVDISNTYYFKPAMDLTKDATAAYDQAYPVKP